MVWSSYLLDIVALAGLVFFFYRGYKRGLIGQAIWLGSFIVAYLAGSWLCYDLANLAGFSIYSDKVTVALAFIVIFLLVIMGMNQVGKWLTKVINLSVIGRVNAILGGVLNSLIYVVVVLVFLNLTMILAPKVDRFLERTITIDEVAKAGKWVMDQRIIDRLKTEVEKIKK